MHVRAKYVSIIMLSCLVLVFNCCTRQNQANVATNESPNTFSKNGSVREIFINHDEPEFPDAEGKEIFTSSCMMCHTLRYISSQPNFPRKTWEAEVNKMIAKYHAPIDSITAGKIVNYLVAVKGTNIAKK
jgi:hypothetical protein